MTLNAKHLRLLEDRGLEGETLVKFGVKSLDRADGDWVELPYYEGENVVNFKRRTISGDKMFNQQAGGKKCFWNINCLLDHTLADKPLIITEGELDALSALQAGFARVVSVPDGAPHAAQGTAEDGRKYSYVQDAMGALSNVKEIILCTDSDGPGVNLLNDLALRLGKARCKWVKYPKDCKDLNDALKRYGVRGVTETIARAQWFRVDGIYRMSELPPAPNNKAHRLGMGKLDDHYRMRAGDLCVIAGVPGHGKSTILNNIAERAVRLLNWPVAFASFEQKPQLDHRRNLRALFHGKPEWDQDGFEIEAADKWIDREFTFLVPNEDDEVTLQWVLERCAAAVIQNGAKLVIIDPWNELDHVRPPDMSLTEYVGFGVKQLRKFARKHDVHLIVAAHPRKLDRMKDGKYSIPSLYEISDSAHFYNKPDIGLIIHRNEDGSTLLRVAKSRYHEIIGTPGDVNLHFDARSRRYQDIEPPMRPQADD